MKRKIWMRFMAVMMLVITAFLKESVPKVAYGKDVRDEIRVGLKSLFTEKKELTVYGDSLLLGFCDGEEFYTELVMDGCGFVTVSPEGQAFFACKERFTVNMAKKLAKGLEERGVAAAAVLYAHDCAGILFASGQSVDWEELCRIAGEFGLTVLEKGAASNRLLKITYGENTLYADGSEGYFPQFAAGVPDEKGRYTVSLGKRCYRGRIEIGRYGSSSLVSAVNVVPIEEYLYGVVPCEMPASWNIEALKAQAVCARSFAMVKAGLHSVTDIKRGYQLTDTEQSQVYGGADVEKASSTRAVNATRGETLCYENRTVSGYYFSASGGHTEDSGDVWNFTLPYLRAVPDVYETNSGGKLWSVSMKREELEALLSRYQKSVGTVQSVVPFVTTKSGRVMVLKITGTNGSTELSTSFIRNMLNFSSTKFKVVLPNEVPDKVSVLGAQESDTVRLRDCSILSADGVQKAGEETSQVVVLSADNLTNFVLDAPKENTFLFAGLGYGHGVGMSQAGARGMAEKGYSYRQILEHYFTGISVR